MVDQETILVLDRDDGTAKRIEAALAPKGYRIVGFTDGAEAADYAAERRPVAVVADLALAASDKGAFLARFRAVHPFVPIVVSNFADESAEFLSVIHFGVNERLVKPFSATDVQEALARALREDDTEFEKAMTAISARLRETRRRLGLKQSVVAVRTGLSVAQICQIENRASTPSLASLLRICRALRIPVGEIVAGI
jgi:DNA-binding NtrC family response regulator